MLGKLHKTNFIVGIAMFDPLQKERQLMILDDDQKFQMVPGDFRELGAQNPAYDQMDARFDTIARTAIGTKAEYFGKKGYYLVNSTARILK